MPRVFMQYKKRKRQADEKVHSEIVACLAENLNLVISLENHTFAIF